MLKKVVTITITVSTSVKSKLLFSSIHFRLQKKFIDLYFHFWIGKTSGNQNLPCQFMIKYSIVEMTYDMVNYNTMKNKKEKLERWTLDNQSAAATYQ